MAQAKVVSEQELKRALGVISGHRHAQRDRMALLLTHWAGMRVCRGGGADPGHSAGTNRRDPRGMAAGQRPDQGRTALIDASAGDRSK